MTGSCTGSALTAVIGGTGGRPATRYGHGQTSMSSPSEPDPPPDDTLDLVKEATWRVWARHRQVPVTPAERELVEDIVTQVWRMVLREPATGDTAPRTRWGRVIALVGLALGAGFPGVGVMGGDWGAACMAASGFLAGVVLTLAARGRK